MLLLAAPVACASEKPSPPTPAPAVVKPDKIPLTSNNSFLLSLIPEGDPVITTNSIYLLGGKSNFLFIYGEGSVLYIEETGLRFISPEHPATRTWKMSKLQPEELDSLLDFIKSSGFQKLDNYYQFLGKPIKGGPAGGFTMGRYGVYCFRRLRRPAQDYRRFRLSHPRQRGDIMAQRLDAGGGLRWGDEGMPVFDIPGIRYQSADKSLCLLISWVSSLVALREKGLHDFAECLLVS